MKKFFASLSFLAMAASLMFAFRISNPIWQGFFVSVSGSFLAIGVTIIMLNIYLERESKRGAIKSLLSLSDQAIASFHNTLLNICWAKFGRETFGDITQEYIKSNGKPEALRESFRSDIYELYNDKLLLKSKITDLETTLIELTRLAGWNLDSTLLESCLNARISINRLQSIILDDSLNAKSKVTEHLLDIDIHAQTARQMLIKLSGYKGDT